MTLIELKLAGFRNHKKLVAGFSDRVTLIIGPNGVGKTNILEAITLLSTGKSFKARYDHEMIYNPDVFGQTKPVGDIFDGSLNVLEFAKVVGLVQNGTDQDTLELAVVKENPNTNFSQKTYKLNGATKSLYQTNQFFTTVLFIPQDLELFTGPPSLRRHYLDNLLYKIDQRYKKEHIVYTKSVRQRNKILEKINKTSKGRQELPFWTNKILESGIYLQQKRLELFKTLNESASEAFSSISDQLTKVIVSYKINELTPQRLEEHSEHEIYAKSTLVGPHRDDFDLLLNGFSISHFGSRGQQRTAVLSLKISELNIINQTIKYRPPLLLDDIFSELDDKHKKTLTNIIQDQQTIITSTQSDISAQNTITL